MIIFTDYTISVGLAQAHPMQSHFNGVARSITTALLFS